MHGERRILFLIGSLSGGGIATSTMRIAEVLQDHLALHLLVLSGRVRDVQVPSDAFESVIFLDEVGEFWFYHLTRAVNVFWKYLSVVSKSNYDCVVSFGEIPGFFGALGKRCGYYKFVASIRTDWESAVRQRGKGSILKHMAYRALYGFVYKSADRLVGVTQAAAYQVQRAFNIDPRRFTYIYNYFDQAKLRALADQPLTDEEKSWFRKGKNTFVAMGRLAYQKGFDVLLHAFAEVRSEGYEATLLIIGKGSEQQNLIDIAKTLDIQNAVIFAGYRSNPYRLMKNADAFVLSSRWEGIANALVEALICSVPVIATNCPAGPREILTTRSGQLLGKLVEAENSTALADAMIEIIENDYLRTDASEYRGLLADSKLVEMEKERVSKRWMHLLKQL